ncbi:Ig domain-containing protein [Streptosporangium sp. NPDC023825]|uniref:Ig domain-containing protein n=1 Tax=Streptosporangium sp. NPDC023825 TaxID=3154909 RepID=UPI0034464D27
MPITIDEPDLQKDWVAQRPGSGCPDPYDPTPGNVIPASAMPVEATQQAAGIDPVAWKRLVVPALELTFSAPPGGDIPAAYSHQLTITGATAPVTWSVASGTLPTGITLSSAGLLAGTPTVAGTYNFVVKATDAQRRTATKSVSLVVVP